VLVLTFSFGQNWHDFVQSYLNEARIAEAKKSLIDFLELQSLDGMSFLDIGCGSGLFSLSAYNLRAAQVVSFDVDPFSVKCCEYLKEKSGNPSNWLIYKGSVLDDSFLQNIERAHIVYAWGVLHHTGKMWQAIRNAARLVKPGGLFFLGIYNKVEGIFGSTTWLRLKQVYNGVPGAGKRFIEFGFVTLILLNMLRRFKNPISEIRHYKKKRGMSFWIDIRDSLGGYPYEFASSEEVIQFCRDELGFHLKNIREVNDLGVNEFLFRNA
jgi:2-polyprenyl-6-hydroxyphenyl methylase/3-demethylubiquinone-9 3-methyltransferase